MAWWEWIVLYVAISSLILTSGFAWEKGVNNNAPDEWDGGDVQALLWCAFLWPLILVVLILFGPFWAIYHIMAYVIRSIKELYEQRKLANK